MQVREKIVALILFLLACTLTAGDYQIVDGKVIFPESDISTTVSFYTVKDVEFFVAKNSSGKIVSHQNACQACGPVGFVQNGTAMKCNGCGLQYELDILGVDNPGSCWPFYVPNTINDGSVEIALTDLGIEETSILQTPVQKVGATVLAVSPEAVSFHVPQKGVYSVSLSTIQGRQMLSQSVSSKGQTMQMRLPSLASGHYILHLSGQGIDVKKVVQLF